MEVSGLRGADLESSADGYTLRVRGKGGHELTVPAHARVVEVIQSYRTLGRLWPLNPNQVSRKACAAMGALGVPGSFHACRHYFATKALAASGGDIVTTSALMRHQSIATTMVYAKLADEKPRNTLNALILPA